MIRTIPDLIETWAEQSPAATAILSPGREPLTYEGLRSQVEHSIQTLQAMGVRRGDRVAVVLPNGPEMASAFLAVSLILAATRCWRRSWWPTFAMPFTSRSRSAWCLTHLP